jgi:hypothetical protein
MSGEDAPMPYLKNLIVLEIKTNKQSSTRNKNKQTNKQAVRATMYGPYDQELGVRAIARAAVHMCVCG